MGYFELVYHHTFSEALEAYDSAFTPWDSTPVGLVDLFYTDFAGAPLWDVDGDDVTAKDYLQDLFNLVFARFNDNYCLASENETLDYGSDEDDETAVDKFMLKLINVMVLTYPKYSVLLAAYASKESALLDQISSTQSGVARFNDTPQNEEADDEFEADAHVTNITKTSATNLTDGMTPIERLKQIQDSFKSVMADWSNEFAKLFYDEEDITL